MKPLVTEAFMLAIIASEGPPAFPGLPGHARDVTKARRDSLRINQATAELEKLAPDRGAYVAESNYFQADWQKAYWGPNSLTVVSDLLRSPCSELLICADFGGWTATR
jgi:hypothetical protein